jgi:acetyl esterase/lipase
MADDAQVKADAGHQIIPLWPDGPPPGTEPVPPEARFQGKNADGVPASWYRNVSDPTLTVYRPDPAKANGVGVIVCPGGGWRILAWVHEGEQVAEWLAARGYTALVLKYRLGPTPEDPEAFIKFFERMNGRDWSQMKTRDAPRTFEQLVQGHPGTGAARQMAAADGRRALVVAREQAEALGVDPARIGMIGFSAGAFLTADVAVNPEGPPLAFAAPIYGGETGGLPVPPDAPPLFTCITGEDRMLFRVVEGLYADWTAADRPCELHIFQRGPHGFGMSKLGLPTDRWIELFEAWLADLGFA